MAKILTDLTQSKPKLLVYGNAGTGKTRLVGSAALYEPTAPAFMLTIGGNPVSLQDYERKPVVVAVEQTSDFNDIYDWFYLGQPITHPVAKVLDDKGLLTDKGLTNFATLIVDGGTMVNEKYWRIITGKPENERADFANVGDGKPIDPGKYRDNIATMTYWGGLYFGLADYANTYPVNVMMTALESIPATDYRSQAAKSAGASPPPEYTQRTRPAFIGQASGALESMAYIVCRMTPTVRFGLVEAKKLGLWDATKRQRAGWNVACFGPDADFVAKDQYGRLGSYMLDPTIEQIWQKLFAV